MNDRSIINAPEPYPRGGWIDAYMPEGQLTNFQPQPQFLNLSAVRGILYRQRWLVAAIIFAAAVAGLILTLLAKPMYEASATVRIEPYGAQIVEGQNLESGVDSNMIFSLLSTQMEIITSRSLAENVAEDLNLGEREDFLGADIDKDRPANLSDDQWIEARQVMAASILQESINAENTDGTWIIEIAYRSQSPTIAAEVANAYSAAFVATDTRSSTAVNEYAQDYLQEQIELTRARLQEAELAANAYARENGIIVQPTTGEDGESGGTLTTANLASINGRVSAARAARIEAEQRWRSIQNLPAAQLPEAQSSAVLQALIIDRAAKRTQLADLRQRYNEDFPQITNLRSQIATIEEQIERSSADIKAAVRNDYIVARNQEQALQAELEGLTGETLAEQDRQVDFSVLEREAQALRDQLQALLNRFNQISTAANVQSGMINPLDSAVAPRAPYAPNLLNNMVLALVLGIGVAVGLAVLREIFDDKVRSLDEAEERIGLPLLGHTPHVSAREISSAGREHYSALMEAYSSIRLTMDFAMPTDLKVIQFTSSEASEGKTTTAALLAELFASLGRKTLLVDADLRRPSIGKLFGVGKPKAGLIEVLVGQSDLESAIIRGEQENLDILPLREALSKPGEIFASSQLSEFIEKNRKQYSLIIFDSSPILGLADAPMLSRLVDGTVFVMEANRAHFGQARAAIKRLRRGGGNPIGAVITKYRALEAGEQYSYQYGYYQYDAAK